MLAISSTESRKDLPAEVEGIAKSGFLALLGCQRLHWLQVEVVVQMQVVQILAVDQQIEHVIPLATHLQVTKKLVENSSLVHVF